MIRNLKMLGLMAVAALAMSAMLASAAQAETDGVFTAGETTANHQAVNLHGDQYGGVADNFFQADVAGGGDIVTCADATFTGTDDNGTATELTIEAKYIHCETGMGDPATVDMNGCDYTFHQPTKIAQDEYTGEASLTCEEDGAIVITVFGFGGPTSHSFLGCTIEVFPNEERADGHDTDRLGGHVIYENDFSGAQHDVTVNATVSGISSRQSGFGCENGEHTDGIYRNTVTVTGTEDKKNGKAIDVWVSDHDEEEEEE